jgi:hypothetical protein
MLLEVVEENYLLVLLKLVNLLEMKLLQGILYSELENLNKWKLNILLLLEKMMKHLKCGKKILKTFLLI